MTITARTATRSRRPRARSRRDRRQGDAGRRRHHHARGGRGGARRPVPTPDILVNNAGGPPPGDFRDWDESDWLQGLQRQHDDRDHADQGDGRRHDRAHVRPHRQHHLELGEGADRRSSASRTAPAPGSPASSPASPARRSSTTSRSTTSCPAASTPTGCARRSRSSAKAAGRSVEDVEPRAAGSEPGRTLRHRRGVRRALRVRLQRPGELHHRPELPDRRRRLPGHPVALGAGRRPTRAGGGAGGVARPRGARALLLGGWAPSGRASSDFASRERVRSTPPAPPPGPRRPDIPSRHPYG